MFIAVVLLGVAGLAFGQPNAADLAKTLDANFDILDQSPRDGVLTETEWDSIMQHDDTDNSSCVTLDEYKAGREQVNQVVASQMFMHIAGAGQSCITLDKMRREFNSIDTNDDGNVTKSEFTDYYTQVVNSVFGSMIG